MNSKSKQRITRSINCRILRSHTSASQSKKKDHNGTESTKNNPSIAKTSCNSKSLAEPKMVPRIGLKHIRINPKLSHEGYKERIVFCDLVCSYCGVAFNYIGYLEPLLVPNECPECKEEECIGHSYF